MGDTITQFLDLLSKYANLLLAAITAAYAFLTWRMASEMRAAREAQSDAHLIASPVPLGPVAAQVRLQNAGPGPAINVSLTISLSPPRETTPRTWRHPALLVGQTEHFLIPGEKIDAPLRDLAASHRELVIEATWTNIFGRPKSTRLTHDLAALAEGWYAAGHLIPPEDLLTQLKETREELRKITRSLDNIGRSIPK